MNWRREFESYIIDRGTDYYLTGRVEQLDVEANVIRADVIGTSGYQVVIDMYLDGRWHYDCDCPYAQGGDHCKHMAAVLLAWEDSPDFTIPADAKLQWYDEVKEMVTKADESIVRDFLVDILFNDSRLAEKFVIRSTHELPSSISDTYHRRISDLLNSIARPVDYDEYGYDYDYDESYDDDYHEYSWSDYLSLKQLVEQELSQLVENGHLEQAWNLSIYIWKGLDEVETAYELPYDEVMTSLIYFWQKLYDTADNHIKAKMFRWMMSDIVETDDSALANFVWRYFPEENYLQKKLELANNKVLNRSVRNMNNSFIMPSDDWVLRRIQLMNQLDYPAAELVQLLEKHCSERNTRLYYVKYCLEHGNPTRAIELLEDAINEIELKDNFRWMPLPYENSIYRQLADIYRDLGDTINYRRTLKEYMQQLKPANLDLWREYRTLWNEAEWMGERQDLINIWRGTQNLNEIYLEENLLEPLLQNVLQGNYYTFNQYEYVLKPHYPDELLEVMKSWAIDRAYLVSGRDTYRFIAGVLRRMLGYPNGKEIVEELVREWRVKYKRRHAMMDELKEF